MTAIDNDGDYPSLRRWKCPRNYFGAEWPDYYSSGFGRSNASDALEISNFRVALRALGGETETVRVVRESHWAVGWVEWIAIHETDTVALQCANKLTKEHSNYAVLDEDDFSDQEINDADQVWRECYDTKQRIDYIRANRRMFEFRSISDMINCVRGHYFSGYASELLQ